MTFRSHRIPAAAGQRRRAIFTGLSTPAAIAALALTATPALAAEFTHIYTGTSFGPDGTAATHFEHPAAIAIDQSTHDVYVLDSSAGAIYRFNEKGEPLKFSGSASYLSGNAITGITSHQQSGESQIAVSSATGTIYATTNSNLLVAFQESGEPADFTAGTSAGTNEIGGFGELLGVGVDPNGDIYAADFRNYYGIVYVYAPSGERLTKFYSEEAANLAVDTHGNVYVNRWQREVEKFAPSVYPVTTATSYTSLGTVDPHTAYSAAIDPATNDLYVDQGSRIAQYEEAGGEPIALFARPGFTGAVSASEGVAVDGASGKVYLSDSSGERQVEIFGPTVPLVDYPLHVAAGPANGTVTSTPAGIECGNGASACEVSLELGRLVTLRATRTERASFAGWEGCEAASGSQCTLTITAATEVTAKFESIPQQTLTVARSGSGDGTLTGSSPGPEFTPIDCGSTCEATYNEHATVVLLANRATHSRFTGWSGCPTVISSTAYATSECEVRMSAAENVKAGFEAIPQQTLNVSVTGEGEVTSHPSGIACGSGGGTCEEHFDSEGPESTVTLLANPSPDNHLERWEGECERIAGTSCVVSMSAARSVHAVFAPTFQTLRVAKSGPGSVSSSPPGIDCGSTCEAGFREGSTLTLTAEPELHNHLTWKGCSGVPSADTCEVVIRSSEAVVEVNFSINLHTVTVIPSGPGTISASSGAISGCARRGIGTCSGEYGENSTLTLTAKPPPDYHVKSWQGCTSQLSEDLCELVIPATDAEVLVTFAPNIHILTVVPIGQGSVRADSGAISRCTAESGTCAGEYIDGAIVTLTGSPPPHQTVAWSGCGRDFGNRCEVQLQGADDEVKVAFVAISHALRLTSAGTGTGQLTCNGAPCAPAYPEGTEITLTATAAPGSTFDGWSGGGCSGTSGCHLTLETATELTATFTANPAPVREECIVPQLAGKTLGQARTSLAAAHCALGEVTKAKSKRHRKHGPLVVHSSSPAADTSLPAATKVNLTLAPRARRRK